MLEILLRDRYLRIEKWMMSGIYQESVFQAFFIKLAADPSDTPKSFALKLILVGM